MNTPAIAPQPRPRHIDTRPLRYRAGLPAATPAPTQSFALAATHDFLVWNPRPDLTVDPRTLRMIESL